MSVQMSHHPMNRSISKQLYSFSKATRFNNTNQAACGTFYDSKVSALGRRAPSFGYGNKISLQSKQKVPPPGQYNKQSEFVLNSRKRKGYSFGGDAKKGLIDENQTQRIPGPGKYQQSMSRFKSVSFSLRGKYADPFESHRSTLGPGQYATLPMINPEGKYFVAKYGGSGCSKIGKTERFVNDGSITPGPGKYDGHKASGINSSGHHFYSAVKTVQTNAFSASPRRPINDKSIAPGPGAYDHLSQFGIRSLK